jgi:hypothetical protein
MLRERWRYALRLTPATRAWFIDGYLCDSILLADFFYSFSPFLMPTTENRLAVSARACVTLTHHAQTNALE